MLRRLRLQSPARTDLMNCSMSITICIYWRITTNSSFWLTWESNCVIFSMTSKDFITSTICACGQSPRLQESCDPSSVLVCSNLHLCFTGFIVEFMHIPFRKCIVIHSLDKKNCGFEHWNAIKMTFLACRQLNFLS